MIVPGSVNPLLLATGGYEIPYSLRFRRSNSAYLSRTMGTPTNNKICTWSFWAKRGTLGTTAGEVLFYSPTAAGGTVTILFDVTSPNALRMYGAGGSFNVTSASVYRDTSAWYHFVIVWNSPEATSSNRFKAWVNGESVSFSGTFPPQNQECSWNNSGTSYFGSAGGPFADSRDYIDGYRAECYFIDGQALTPSSFGQTDSATGVWVPKKYSGTYGTNGFYLKFADASAATATAIGKDSSGNGNNWTPSGISVTSGTTFDQMLDTPTLNYAVMNPLSKSSTPTPAQANLFISMGAVYPANVLGSIGVSSGKFYFETSLSGTGGSANGYAVGVATGNWANLNADPGGNSTSYTHLIDSRAYFSNNAATTNNSTSFTAGDIIGIAIDANNLTITFYKNNVQVGSAQTLESGQTWFPMFKNSTSAATLEYTANFGQRSFSYTPPTGFKALNTANLPTPSIKKGDTYFDAELYTGNGTSQSVTGYGFQPDLVWIKGRNYTSNHRLSDAVRGVNKSFMTNTTGAEDTSSTNYVTAFNSNGFSVSSGAGDVNQNTQTYVAWAWKEGATPGFDIVTYAGNATNRTIAHSLGAVPEMMIIKNRDLSTSVPVVYHSKLNGGTNPANNYLYTSSTAAEAANSAFFNNTSPTSSVFTVGTDTFVNANAQNLVAYLWSEIEGFSKFGSYTGNASTDGPFVWCGFRPKFVMVKCSGATAEWAIQDTARSTSNPSDPTLYPNLSNLEGTNEPVDFLSNGFKLRNILARWNSNATSYIFAAFAENPFKYARAR